MKKQTGIKLILMIALVLIIPIHTYAKDSQDELLKCKYIYGEKEFIYTVYNNRVSKPFQEGEKINYNNWYHEDNFENRFLSSIYTSNQKLACPSLIVEENELFNTVFLNGKDELECNGTCQVVLPSTDSDNINVIWTKMGPSVAKYQSSEYFLPVFRKLSDGTLEWSIDNYHFYSVYEKISIDSNTVVSMEDTFTQKVFTNQENISNIYRCIFYSNGVLEYKLSADEAFCKNKVFSNQDNQALGSIYYHSLLGADGDNTKKDTCETILGNPNNASSVAWLLKKLLGYLRIIGSMLIIVLSIIDFTKIIVSGDDEQAQKIYKKFIYRLILLVALFFLPTLIMALLQLFHFTSDPICSLK